ncbi:GMC oxidoreductase [Streptomyces sp. NPDC018833]|uniref:GMC oxidoreductase n=1 Tax=Streptomyces sp. NPDC018833 TaxID=3365053 RepID=UPI0037AE0812
MDDQHYDVVIVGSGAGGGTLAHRLAPSGKRVLIIERGGYLPRERENWQSRAVFVESRYRADDIWYDHEGRPFPPEVNYYVGGNTKFFGAALFRLRPEDFHEIRHHGGLSPGWPLDYTDLEPYYSQAEQLYRVHGEHGTDPTEGPASLPYPHPPVTHEPRIQQLADRLGGLGLHPFPLPIGVDLTEGPDGVPTRDSACVRCDQVDGFPCLLLAKSDAETVCVTPALRHENVSLLTHARVDRLETDPTGRTVTEAVTTLEDGTTARFRADVFAVACGAVNSAVLLLNSASARHPRGLANSSDVVGRHYLRHNNEALMAVSREPNPTRFQKTLAMNDWYLGADDWDYPLGGIQMLGKSDAEQIRADAPHWAGVSPPDMPLEVLAHHSVDFWLCGEDLPDPDNRVTVGPDGHVRLALRDTNTEGLRRLRHKLAGMLEALGMHPHRLLPHMVYLHKDMPIGATAHQAGTVRFGTDPDSSALDVNCRAHDLDNLYVVDAGFLPSIGAVNPSLTVMANALRVGDHLVQRLG